MRAKNGLKRAATSSHDFIVISVNIVVVTSFHKKTGVDAIRIIIYCSDSKEDIPDCCCCLHEQCFVLGYYCVQ